MNNEFMFLTEEQIDENYNKLRYIINNEFSTRKNELNVLYDEYGDKIKYLPASPVEYYHNAFIGGYVDHILRVYSFAISEYERWGELGLLVDNFTLDELKFSAVHHDLGKCGLPGYNPYQINESEWHRKNQGKLFEHDKNQPFFLVPDGSLFILQNYGVKLSVQEYWAIRTHDGIYDRANEAYYFSKTLDSKVRTNINQILHNADMLATRFEFERWAKNNPEKFKFYSDEFEFQPVVKKEKIEKLSPDQVEQILNNI